jgi:nucleoporin POM152
MQEGGERAMTPRDLKIPFSLTMNELGEHIYTLNSITDGLGNTVDLTLPPSPLHRHKFTSDITRTISVLRPGEFSFHGCRPGHTVDIIQGRETKLQLMAGYYDKRDGPWKLLVQYTPASSLAATTGDATSAKATGKRTQDKAGWTKEIDVTDKYKKFRAEGPGEYKLLSAQGRVCKGDVLSPEVCRVVELPMPKAEIQWRPLHEWCVFLTSAIM